ncbi:MAG: PEGA domain-containing protein, partial [Gammaproteobacteria bacterium]|nr:PEGA domain-containing protein [Gammaproteobacteria bacterium]
MTKLDQIDNTAIPVKEYQAPTGVVATRSFSLSRGHWLLIGVALASLLFIFFISIARSIQISAVTASLTDPEQMTAVAADIEIDSRIKLPIGSRVLVLPGTHTVTARAPGFKSATQNIDVASGRHQKFVLNLNLLPGKLDISLNPDIAAEVSLDGEAFGNLPGLLDNVPAGQHEIGIDAPLYRATSQSVLVRGRELTETLTVDLEPAWGNLTIHSKPDSANVSIDGRVVGQTPMQLRVEEGTHTLSLNADKYKSYSQDFTIAAQQDLLVDGISLM